jgi:hypothetical protein
MTTAVIGATGRVGSDIVRGVLARGERVSALVRDPGKARSAFGDPGGLHIRPTRLDDPRDLAEAFDFPADHGPPPTPGRGVPARPPRGIPLMPPVQARKAFTSAATSAGYWNRKPCAESG